MEIISMESLEGKVWKTLLCIKYFLDQIRPNECLHHADGPCKPAFLGCVCCDALSFSKDAIRTVQLNPHLHPLKKCGEDAHVTSQRGPFMRQSPCLMRKQAEETQTRGPVEGNACWAQ